MSNDSAISGTPTSPGRLHREIGLAGATLLGLGSILGTGVFVSLALGAGITGPAVVFAVAAAAIVAFCNGMSSAQLAANHPVSGGTYEYGYRWLSPSLGFTAGWMFLCAKSASAATAALGFAGYVNRVFDWELGTSGLRAVGVLTVALVTGVTLAGMRRSNLANAIIVLFTIGTLAGLVVASFFSGKAQFSSHFSPMFVAADPSRSILGSFLEATALMFVAYTGYGRIATLGEEVHNPSRTIPVAILTTLAVSFLVYAAVATSAVAVLGSAKFSEAAETTAAPLFAVAQQVGQTTLLNLISVGAMTAMLGVLLNLVLGLSRVLLAMGRRGDMPFVFGQLNASQTSPQAAILGVATLIGLIVLVGSVKLTWSFSAFTVLIYYALTNLAALRLSGEERLYPRFLSVAGFAFCLGLAWWVEPEVWGVGVAILVVGLLWHAGRAPYRRQATASSTVSSTRSSN